MFAAAMLTIVTGTFSLAAPHKDIVDTAASAGSFNTLVTAVNAAGLVDALKSDGPFTVFAPSDEAFAKLPEGTIPALLKDKDKLQSILKYHVVAGKVTAADVMKLDSAETLLGRRVHIRTTDQGVSLNDANVVKTDILASNGIIHVIDSVLLPPAPEASESAARQIIRRAVSHGAPLYNRGHHGACAAVYEVAAMSLMMLHGDQMPSSVRSDLGRAMKKAGGTHCPTSRAWALRHGLDAVYSAMSEIE
jgi:uncharacterized surface protein with fasciclin (FAS1) repeats